jgi:hypothetical protein
MERRERARPQNGDAAGRRGSGPNFQPLRARDCGARQETQPVRTHYRIPDRQTLCRFHSLEPFLSLSIVSCAPLAPPNQ